MADENEIAKRKQTALDAIIHAHGTSNHETDVALFVEHHLAEIEGRYWQTHLGNSSPKPEQVLSILELKSHWSDDDESGIDTFDFTLPGEITNYILCVRFDEAGRIEEIVMES
ncbi:MAG: DUF2004 domain-containing protein [Pseudomonadota bacterium]